MKVRLCAVLLAVAGSASATRVVSHVEPIRPWKSLHRLVATGHGLYWAQLPSVLEKVDVLKLGSSRATQVYLLVQHDELADKVKFLPELSTKMIEESKRLP